MEISEILKDSLTYPLNNIKSLAIYMILCVIVGLILAFTGVFTIASVNANSVAYGILAFIGLIIAVIVMFMVEGYVLDIVKIAIQRDTTSPSIDVVRQTTNGIKAVLLSLVYFIIPIIIAFILTAIFQEWLALLIAIILFIIFGLALTTAMCKLAQTEDLKDALNVQEAIADISRIGIVKVLLTVIAIALISAIISVVIVSLAGIGGQEIAAIISGILNVYLLFFETRAIGLLYSDIN